MVKLDNDIDLHVEHINHMGLVLQALEHRLYRELLTIQINLKIVELRSKYILNFF